MDTRIFDAFEMLGLQQDVSPDEVHLAFGRKVEPLIPAGDLAGMKRLGDAKDVVLAHLANERREFDELLHILDTTDHNLFILGRAGTGKSALLSNYLSRGNSGVAACAFTGVAAQNIEAPTIHSLFRIAGGPGELKGKPSAAATANATLSQIKTLIIDEISMAPGWLIDEADKALRLAKDRAKPFGGVRLIFVGDPLQLAPFIGKGEQDKELHDWVQKNYESLWFFDSHAFQDPDFEFKMFELTTVFRQDEPEFVEVLDSMREGKLDARQAAYLNERVAAKPENADVLTIATTNAIVDSVNERKMRELGGEFVTFHGADRSLAENEKFLVPGNTLPVPTELKLKVGAQVMFTKNDDQNSDGIEKRWVNGTLGIVTAFAADKLSVFVRINDGVPIEVKTSTWSRFKYQIDEEEDRKTGRKIQKLVKRAVAEYTQIPLNPAWAVTINKSQGKTYDRVHIDLGNNAWAEGQAYVAFSRVRKYTGMTLENRVTQADIKTSSAALNFIDECRHYYNIRKTGS